MIHSATIYAKNLDRMAEFYRALGLTLDESHAGDYVVLTAPGIEISIVQIPERIASRIEFQSPPQAREATPIKLAFVVPSIGDTLEAARLLGGRIKEDSKKWHFRGYSIQEAIDPEGNVFQLRQPI